MSSSDPDHPIRKTLKRKLTNGDSYDNYGGFASNDGSPEYSVVFNSEPDCVYFLHFLKGQFLSQIEGQSVTIKAYAGIFEVFAEVRTYLDHFSKIVVFHVGTFFLRY